MATESTEKHGKISNGYSFFPCFSVDSVAILSVIDPGGRTARAGVLNELLVLTRSMARAV
jgi:hypothetical protein